MVEVLLRLGARADRADAEGRTARALAEGMGAARAIRALRSGPPDVEGRPVSAG